MRIYHNRQVKNGISDIFHETGKHLSECPAIWFMRLHISIMESTKMPEAEKMESGEQVEFVHQVQIFLSVLSSVLDCENGVSRDIIVLS